MSRFTVTAQQEEAEEDSSAEPETTYTWTLDGERDVTEDNLLISLRTKLDAISFESVYAWNPDDTLLEQCGLKEPGAQVTVDYTDSDGAQQTVTLTVGGPTETEDGEDPESYYVLMNGDTTRIYTISAGTAQCLRSIAQLGYDGAAAQAEAES